MSYEDIIYLGLIANIISLVVFFIFTVIEIAIGNSDIKHLFYHTKAINRKKYVFWLAIIIPFLATYRAMYVIYILLSNKSTKDKMKILRLEDK